MFEVFPFTIRAYETSYGVINPKCMDSFRKAKPDGLSWYAFDIEVLSKSKALFTLYGMRSTFSGGIGEKVATFEGKLTREDSRKLIDWRIRSLAEEMECREEEARRKKRVEDLVTILKYSIRS